MGYLSINNLYKDQEILLFKECYAMEKVHGTSAHITWKNNKLTLFSGGVKYDEFVKLFDITELNRLFVENFNNIDCIIYGEAYGGKQQKMSHTYGKELQFIVFDVRIGESWLDVPKAEQVATRFGLEFVPYERIPTTLEAIDAARDADSVVAVRRGMGTGHIREGVVLRPLIEVTKNNGNRIICKHKREEFAERQHQPKVIDVAKLAILADSNAIANEWVTEMRLAHILDKHPEVKDMSFTKDVMGYMVEDIEREAANEIIMSKEAKTAIGRETAKLLKKYLTNSIPSV